MSVSVLGLQQSHHESGRSTDWALRGQTRDSPIWGSQPPSPPPPLKAIQTSLPEAIGVFCFLKERTMSEWSEWSDRGHGKSIEGASR